MISSFLLFGDVIVCGGIFCGDILCNMVVHGVIGSSVRILLGCAYIVSTTTRGRLSSFKHNIIYNKWPQKFIGF